MVRGNHDKAQILKSVETTLRVLSAFDNGKPDRGLTELAEELQVSKATIYRVLATLEKHRYVVQSLGSGRYRLGPRLIHLGQVAMAELDLLAEARSYLKELRDRTEETVHLAILDEGEAIYVAKMDGLKPVQVVSQIGTRSPVHCVSTGKVLLAYTEPNFVERLLERGLVAYTDLTHATPSSLLEELERVRQHGYAVNWGEYRTEVRGIAAPVLNGTGQVVAALGVCGPASRLTEERINNISPTVVEIAAQLSAHLGAPRGGYAVRSSQTDARDKETEELDMQASKGVV